MKRVYTLLLLSGALTLHAQQINGSFDGEWVADTIGNASIPGTLLRPGTQPEGWQASNVNQKVMMTKTAVLVTPDADRTKVDEGHSVKMVNTYVGVGQIGSNAPAYITLGAPWVYAVMNLDQCDGGTLGGMAFTHRPDAITGWYKAEGLTDTDPAKVIAYAWNGTYTSKVLTNPKGGLTANTDTTVTDQDRVIWYQEGYTEATDDAKLISKSELAISENTDEWTPFTMPINYLDTETLPQKINVVFSACNYWQRSLIAKDGTLWVDDVAFVYYHALSALTIDGVPVAGFAEKKTAYTVDVPYTDDVVVDYKVKGVGAKAEGSYNAETCVYTITVKGDDYAENPESKTVYTIQFKQIDTAIGSVGVHGAASAPVFNLKGQRVAAPVKGANIIGGKKLIK